MVGIWGFWKGQSEPTLDSIDESHRYFQSETAGESRNFPNRARFRQRLCPRGEMSCLFSFFLFSFPRSTAQAPRVDTGIYSAFGCLVLYFGRFGKLFRVNTFEEHSKGLQSTVFGSRFGSTWYVPRYLWIVNVETLITVWLGRMQRWGLSPRIKPPEPISFAHFGFRCLNSRYPLTPGLFFDLFFFFSCLTCWSQVLMTNVNELQDWEIWPGFRGNYSLVTARGGSDFLRAKR